MTDDELLRDAARALRDDVGDVEGPGTLGRARVLAAVHGERRRRATWIAWVVPAAALLVGTTAWASAGGHLPRWFGVMAPAPSVDVAEVPTTPARAVPASRATAPSPSPAASVATPMPSVAAAAPAVSGAAATPAGGVSASPPLGGSSAPAPSASTPPHDDVAEALYRSAHRAHYVDRDPAGALTAWNDYLRRAPRGRFAAEASYARALCLVRLGRHDEARRALEPFANGRWGGYRRSEARALVDALPR